MHERDFAQGNPSPHHEDRIVDLVSILLRGTNSNRKPCISLHWPKHVALAWAVKVRGSILGLLCRQNLLFQRSGMHMS